ncbi:alphaK I8 [Puccinia graminis f. sp. tritici CRL 75-36-700-3]|uniref:AlphaK I8 n=1 Tax=Puccinia graminis f. sp. tritici (strain CRL 75-36-700-3 / race SCCL) TaxID=418459 RepID=E3JQH5_PUCGT|nr:alphaK I8 [Puccinia graminis f. sp. tritici CRL 75-36-700-3]EFP74487.2 alphaK I8 [Puccinia graminis f. sp. tritici CRL 75-36-700-3]
MVRCIKCKKWSAGPHFANWCRQCLLFFGLDPDSDPLFLASQSNSLNSILPPNPPPPVPPQSQAIGSSETAATHTSATISLRSSADVPVCAGTKAHFQAVGKAKRHKTPLPSASPYSKSKKVKSSASTDDSNKKIFINAGALVLRDEKLKKLAAKYSHDIDITNPNLYSQLKQELWDLFSSELIQKSMITTPLPASPLDQITLSHGESRLPNLRTLLAYISNAKKKPIPIDIIYEEPSDINTDISTRMSRSSNTQLSSQATSQSTSRRSLRDSTCQLDTRQLATRQPANLHPLTHEPEQSMINHNMFSTVRRNPAGHSQNYGFNNDTWANGPIAATVPCRGVASLDTQIAHLGQPLGRCLITINPDGWIVAQRLTFKNNDYSSIQLRSENAPPSELIATSTPITICIDKSSPIGRGSMRVAYPVKIKTNIDGDGNFSITNFVAKERFIDQHPLISNHATDSRMYQACGLLLQEFKNVLSINTDPNLSPQIRQKAAAFNMVRHCVVVTGNKDIPSKIYFIEAVLRGHYVKYSSNVNFTITRNQPGMDIENLEIMNAFTHWSYINSHGQSLVCDLQGVGNMVTDPQIIDLDPNRWADGNNAAQGIQMFLQNH